MKLAPLSKVDVEVLWQARFKHIFHLRPEISYLVKFSGKASKFSSVERDGLKTIKFLSSFSVGL
jgi:hypothetical protein